MLTRITNSMRAKLLAHIEIMRPYTVAYAGMLGLAGATLSRGGEFSLSRALTSCMVTMCGWLAGHYVGDYFDRDIDLVSKPYRSIPSGRVSPAEAVTGMLLLIGVGNLAALRLGRRALALAFATTGLGIAYSKVFKSRALLGNLDRGVLGACAVLFGAICAQGGVCLPVSLLATVTVLHDGATNLVGAIRDVDGDRASSCVTVPVLYGVSRSVEVASAMAGASTCLGVVTLVLVRPSRIAVALFAAAAVLASGVYGQLLLRRERVARPEALNAHKWLVAERLILMSAFTACRAPLLAIVALTLSLPTSMALQLRMRDRYERQAAERAVG